MAREDTLGKSGLTHFPQRLTALLSVSPHSVIISQGTEPRVGQEGTGKGEMAVDHNTNNWACSLREHPRHLLLRDKPTW